MLFHYTGLAGGLPPILMKFGGKIQLTLKIILELSGRAEGIYGGQRTF